MFFDSILSPLDLNVVSAIDVKGFTLSVFNLFNCAGNLKCVKIRFWNILTLKHVFGRIVDFSSFMFLFTVFNMCVENSAVSVCFFMVKLSPKGVGSNYVCQGSANPLMPLDHWGFLKDSLTMSTGTKMSPVNPGQIRWIRA